MFFPLLDFTSFCRWGLSLPRLWGGLLLQLWPGWDRPLVSTPSPILQDGFSTPEYCGRLPGFGGHLVPFFIPPDPVFLHQDFHQYLNYFLFQGTTGAPQLPVHPSSPAMWLLVWFTVVGYSASTTFNLPLLRASQHAAGCTPQGCRNLS